MNSSPASSSATDSMDVSRHDLLTSLSLRTRIFLTCGLLVTLCLITSAIGWRGIQSLLTSFQRFEKTDAISFSVLEIDRTVPELKAAAESFLHTGAESQHRKAMQLVGDLVQQIDSTSSEADDDELIDLLQEMKLHLKIFEEQLAPAAEERNLRTRLVQVVLPESAEKVLKLFASLRGIYGGERPDVEQSLAVAERQFSDARAGLLQYLTRPEYSSFKKMVDLIDETRKSIQSLRTDEASASLMGDLTRLLTAINEYEEHGQRTFQATRGYLFYSNVVMAGEISEFVYYSNQLKKTVEKKQEQNVAIRSAAAASTRKATIVASLVALSVACALAVMLSYAVVSPLTRLTETFRKLASGQTIDSIPGADRGDEIGRMAKAAEVFSDKNRETQELLDHANELAAELEAKASQLEETNQELDNFAYVASHDLKSPLRGIENLAQWVEEDCHELIPDSSREHLGLMRDRVGKMNGLLDDLLEYSRVGRIGQQSREVDLNELVRSIVDVIDNPNQLKFRIPDGLPVFETAVTPLQQVVLNLLTNAVKYNDKGSDGWIELRCHENGQFYNFEVADNGIGIAPEHYERVFQMYQRVALDQAEGSGMGLAIVRKQIENYGGKIDVESEVGQGTTFRFTWPKQISEQQ